MGKSDPPPVGMRFKQTFRFPLARQPIYHEAAPCKDGNAPPLAHTWLPCTERHMLGTSHHFPRGILVRFSGIDDDLPQACQDNIFGDGLSRSTSTDGLI